MAIAIFISMTGDKTEFEKLIDQLRDLNSDHSLNLILDKSKESRFYYKKLREAISEETEKFASRTKEISKKRVRTPKKRPDKLDLPTSLHAAHDRQTLLYKSVNHLHPQLDLLYAKSPELMRDACLKIKSQWKEIAYIYSLLDYFAENGLVLENKYQMEILCEELTRDEALNRRNNNRSYITKNKGNPLKAHKVSKRRKQNLTIEKQLSFEENTTIYIREDG